MEHQKHVFLKHIPHVYTRIRILYTQSDKAASVWTELLNSFKFGRNRADKRIRLGIPNLVKA